MRPSIRARRRRSAILRPLLLATLLGAGALPAGAGPDLDPIPGRPPAPDFTLQDPAGHPQRLADYRGRPLILNFWATWCPPCLAEMPALQRASERLAGEGVGVLTINVGDDAQTIDEFLEETPVGLPIAMDPGSEVAQQYPMKGLPTTFVIDPGGLLVYRAEGERAWDDPRLLDQVRALKGP